MRPRLLCTVGIAATLAMGGPALAGTMSGVLGGSYANFSNGGGDVYSIDGAAAIPIDGNWGAEVTGGYHRVTAGGGADLGNVGGSIDWAGTEFRAAVTVNYLDLSLFHLTTYGAGGEWYASPQWTVSARAGGASGQFGIDGGYFGGDVKYYFTPDISVNAGVDYINLSGFNHVTSEVVRGEWLLSETTPVSLFGGYAHADLSASSADIFFVGLKLYFNDGPATLVDRQRSGDLGYIGSVPYYGQEL